MPSNVPSQAAVEAVPLTGKFCKTVLCRFFATPAGCSKGSLCTFAHGEEELQQAAPDGAQGPAYKAVPCWHFDNKGTCAHGKNCKFAHGEGEQLLSKWSPSLDQEVIDKLVAMSVPDMSAILKRFDAKSKAISNPNAYLVRACENANKGGGKGSPQLGATQKDTLCADIQNGGECALGSQCPFAHTEEERQAAAEKKADTSRQATYKSVICWHFESRGHCAHGSDCGFAHGEGELLMSKWSASLDQDAMDCLQGMDSAEMQEILQRLDAQGGRVQNPSAYVLRACTNVKQQGTATQAKLGAEAAEEAGDKADFKTTFCWQFKSKGECSRGAACKFSHGEDDMLLSSWSGCLDHAAMESLMNLSSKDRTDVLMALQATFEAEAVRNPSAFIFKECKRRAQFTAAAGSDGAQANFAPNSNLPPPPPNNSNFQTSIKLLIEGPRADAWFNSDANLRTQVKQVVQSMTAKNMSLNLPVVELLQQQHPEVALKIFRQLLQENDKVQKFPSAFVVKALNNRGAGAGVADNSSGGVTGALGASPIDGQKRPVAVVCKQYMRMRSCSAGDSCKFAHVYLAGRKDQRPPPPPKAPSPSAASSAPRPKPPAEDANPVTYAPTWESLRSAWTTLLATTQEEVPVGSEESGAEADSFGEETQADFARTEAEARRQRRLKEEAAAANIEELFLRSGPAAPAAELDDASPSMHDLDMGREDGGAANLRAQVLADVAAHAVAREASQSKPPQPPQPPTASPAVPAPPAPAQMPAVPPAPLPAAMAPAPQAAAAVDLASPPGQQQQPVPTNWTSMSAHDMARAALAALAATTTSRNAAPPVQPVPAPANPQAAAGLAPPAAQPAQPMQQPQQQPAPAAAGGQPAAAAQQQQAPTLQVTAGTAPAAAPAPAAAKADAGKPDLDEEGGGDGNEPACPPGWRAKWSGRRNRYFYFRVDATGKATERGSDGKVRSYWQEQFVEAIRNDGVTEETPPSVAAAPGATPAGAAPPAAAAGTKRPAEVKAGATESAKRRPAIRSSR